MHIFIIFIDIDVASTNILNKERTLSEIENEIAALSTIKSVLNSFTEKLNLNIEKLALLDDKELLEIMDSLTISKINFKEETLMTDLNQTNEKLNQLTDKYEWANNHEKYEIVWGNPDCMNGFMEEHLNAMNHYLWSYEECDQQLQLDLLIPIKEKSTIVNNKQSLTKQSLESLLFITKKANNHGQPIYIFY